MNTYLIIFESGIIKVEKTYSLYDAIEAAIREFPNQEPILVYRLPN
jgi:hypothetical protein